jgi:hypothetical protein
MFVGGTQEAGGGPRRPVEIGNFGGSGLVRAEAGIGIGERVFERGQPGHRPPVDEPRIVARIDRKTRADLGEWLITWTGEPSQGDRAAPAVTLDPERFEHVLLAWVYERAERGEMTANLAGFAPGDVPLDCALPLAGHLQSAGLLLVSSDAGAVNIVLTTEGAAAAKLAVAERGNQSRRTEELRNGIVRWLWEWDDVDASADFRDFIRDHRCTFRGHFFDLNAVEKEYLYLVEKGLVHSSSPWWSAPRLTATGRDCAAYAGGNVKEHLNPLQPNGTINLNGINSGNVAIGREVIQSASQLIPYTGMTSIAAADDEAALARTSTVTLGKTAVPKNRYFWTKFRAFASGTSGVIIFVCTVLIAVFTILMWIILNK